MKVIDSRYKAPGRKHFSKTVLPQHYAELQGKVEEQLYIFHHYWDLV